MNELVGITLIDPAHSDAPQTILTDACGHHCGVGMQGRAQYVAHCDCAECHGVA